MYEGKTYPLLSRRRFAKRLALHAFVGLAVVAFSLLIGMLGYEYFEGLKWRDAFLNAAMLVGGMGPVDAPKTDQGKLFAGCYALYAGLVLLSVAGILLAPIAHRVLHKIHLEESR